MHFSDLLNLGKVVLLLCCVLGLADQTCDRFMILYMKPPKFWFKSLQGRADAAVARFEKAFAAADLESKKHYQSEQLRKAFIHVQLRFAPHGSRFPWFSPRQFVIELEEQSKQMVSQFEAAVSYQQSAAFMLEAATQLRLDRAGHPERVARSVEQIESDFQQRQERLQEAKEIAIREAYERHAVIAQSIEEQLGAVENTLQQLVVGTTINTI